MSRYTVWDRGMVWEWVAAHAVCPVLGHHWQRKMRDKVCTRCRTSRPL